MLSQRRKGKENSPVGINIMYIIYHIYVCMYKGRIDYWWGSPNFVDFPNSGRFVSLCFIYL